MFCLPEPAVYTPWAKGGYEVAPGLKPFGTDFGNGEQDRKLFQFDDQFTRFRESKLKCLRERQSKYRLRHDLEPMVERALIELITARLVEDWPTLFQGDAELLECRLTSETIRPDLDSLALQLQEDFAVVSAAEGRDWISYLNFCSPSHWTAESKAGESFFRAHIPVPGFSRINAAAAAMVEAMIHRGPFVRFVWGLESDDRLNHHPEPPPGADPVAWQGRQFERNWFARVERQTIWGLPDVGAALFLVRVGLESDDVIQAKPRLMDSLVAAVRSMSPEALEYKGLRGWLERYSDYRSSETP